jgi:hypothetical protein
MRAIHHVHPFQRESTAVIPFSRNFYLAQWRFSPAMESRYATPQNRVRKGQTSTDFGVATGHSKAVGKSSNSRSRDPDAIAKTRSRPHSTKQPLPTNSTDGGRTNDISRVCANAYPRSAAASSQA